MSNLNHHDWVWEDEYCRECGRPLLGVRVKAIRYDPKTGEPILWMDKKRCPKSPKWEYAGDFHHTRVRVELNHV